MMMEELLLVLNLADLADDKKVVKEVTAARAKTFIAIF